MSDPLSRIELRRILKAQSLAFFTVEAINADIAFMERPPLFFYSKEIGEPPHVHVLKDAKQLKVWLRECMVARNVGFAPHEVNVILKVIADNKDDFEEAWHDHFGD